MRRSSSASPSKNFISPHPHSNKTTRSAHLNPAVAVPQGTGDVDLGESCEPLNDCLEFKADEAREAMTTENENNDVDDENIGTGSRADSKASVNSRRGSLLERRPRLVQHRSMYWISVPLGEESLEMDDTLVVDDHGVPKEVIVKYIEQEIANEVAFLSLPFALILFFVYCMCFLQHDHAIAIGSVEDAITTDLHENARFAYSDPGWMGHKDFYDVHSVPDVYSWFRLGLAPLLFRPVQIWSELNPEDVKNAQWPETPLAKKERPLYLQYNRLIGGLQITQLRGETTSCPNQEIADALEILCSPSGDVVPLELNLEPEPHEIKMSDFPVDPNFDIFLLVHDHIDGVELRLRQMELSHWIGNSTVMVAGHFMTYNAHFDALTLTSAMFFFPRSGKVWRIVLHSTFILNPYGKVSMYFWDFALVAMILSLLATELREVKSACKQRSLKSALRSYFNVWNVVDWLSITAGIFLIIMWIWHCFGMASMKDQLLEILSVAETLSGDQASFEFIHLEKMVRDIYASFRTQHQFSRILRTIQALFPVVIAMRFFKAFNAQPRLALITRTMAVAANDLFHFGVVFLATFLSFTMMANTLFARDLESFRTFGRSFATCFAVLMGDFDLVEMKEAGRTMSFCWFLLFQVTMFLIMVNMLLAIIMDIYTDVKSHVHDVQNLHVQLDTLVRRWRQNRAGQRLTLQKVGHSLSCDGHDEKVVFKLNDFLAAVPGLQEEQAHRVMVASVRTFRFNHETPMGLSEAMRAISDIRNQMSGVFEIIQNRESESRDSKKTSPKASKAKLLERSASTPIGHETQSPIDVQQHGPLKHSASSPLGHDMQSLREVEQQGPLERTASSPTNMQSLRSVEQQGRSQNIELVNVVKRLESLEQKLDKVVENSESFRADHDRKMDKLGILMEQLLTAQQNYSGLEHSKREFVASPMCSCTPKAFPSPYSLSVPQGAAVDQW